MFSRTPSHMYKLKYKNIQLNQDLNLIKKFFNINYKKKLLGDKTVVKRQH